MRPLICLQLYDRVCYPPTNATFPESHSCADFAVASRTVHSVVCTFAFPFRSTKPVLTVTIPGRMPLRRVTRHIFPATPNSRDRFSPSVNSLFSRFPNFQTGHDGAPYRWQGLHGKLKSLRNTSQLRGLTHPNAIDLGVDPLDLRLPVRYCAHLHATNPSPLEIELVRLPLDRLRPRCLGSDNLRHAHIPDGRHG
jgi:hypothetical protein